MKVFLYLLFLCTIYTLIFFGYVKSDKNVDLKNLSVVTKFPDLDKFFLKMKMENRKVPASNSIDIDTKQFLCARLLENVFFRKLNEDFPFDLKYKSNRDYLIEKYPQIAKEIYADTPRKGCFICCQSPEYTYVNRNSVHQIRMNSGPDNAEEMFLCLARNWRRRNIIKYYISTFEYKLDKSDASLTDDYIAGRFVFSYNKDQALVLTALAEEAGKKLFRGTLEELEKIFALRDDDLRASETAEEDPICALSDSEKLRLCAIVLNTPPHLYINTEQTKFVPRENSVHYACSEIRVSFQTTEGISAAASKVNNFREWMIGCEVETNSRERRTFRVSTGYHNMSAFVHQVYDERTYLYNLVGNISVLDNRNGARNEV